VSPAFGSSQAVSWSRSRESSLSIDTQGSAVRSLTERSASRTGSFVRAIWSTTAGSNSGSSPRSSMASRAMTHRSER
jgi:hypothetical protein